MGLRATSATAIKVGGRAWSVNKLVTQCLQGGAVLPDVVNGLLPNIAAIDGKSPGLTVPVCPMNRTSCAARRAVSLTVQHRIAGG